jgi:hypothetical protein
MNLAEMASFICSELGVFDDTALGLCKKFLSKEYHTLWDKYPWGDANGYGSVQVAAAVKIINYPDGMDRVITVRASQGASGVPPPVVPDEPDDPEAPAPVSLDSRFLDPVDSTFLIESEPTIFEDRGYVRYYEEIGNATQRQIRLYPIPTWGTTLLFYGKLICPGLVADTDTIGIRNLEPAVMAYAYFNMLQRQRQYGKADLKRKEAQELEQVAWNLEQQQANQPRRTKAITVAGNSLAEMTDAVCTICGQWTPEYRLIIRECLRRNYQTMYDTFLWPESLVMVRVPYASEQVVMPPYIDKVLGVRGTNDMRMFPADAVLFLDITPSIFEEIGDPIGYTTLTPVAVSTLPATTTRLLLASTSPVDRTKVFIRGEVLATGQELQEELTLQGTAPTPTQYSYDIPLTIAKGITLGDVTVNAAIAGDEVTAGGNLAIIPANQRELKHQRLWFLPAPNSHNIPEAGYFTALVLGKRAIRPLVTDQDTPIITGVQQILIAAAAGDLFRKLEKHDLAAAMLQKASSSTDVLKAKNMDQAASSPRFVPQIESHAYVAGVGGWNTW